MNPKEVRVLVVAPLGVGGVTSMMINIQKHIDREKINFDYLVFHDRKEPSENIVFEMGSKKYTASVDHIKCRPLRKILRMDAVRKICKENHISILHYNADSAADMINVIGAKLGGVKYITVHSHNAGYGNAGKGIKVLGTIMRPLIPFFCDTYFGCSDLAAKFLFPSKIIHEKKYSVLQNGIELNKYKFDENVRLKIRNELSVEERFVIGHVGRFEEQKNHDFLLEIFAEIVKRDKTAVLILFGVGSLMDKIKDKAHKLNIAESVIFYGTSDKMNEMFQAMDVFLMPSLHEGLPVTGIEAQASGLPCVFSDTITREVDVSNKSTFLSLSQGADEWAEKILALRNIPRVDAVKMLKEAHYDIQDTANTISELYIRVGQNLNEENKNDSNK